jgi:hypothetical protein
MKAPAPGSLPDRVISATVMLAIAGLCLGLLYGLDLISILVLDAIFFGALVLFVPWAVWKLDPRALAEFRDSSDDSRS